MLSREIVLANQQQSFHALLRHVWQSSSFYRDLYSASGIGQAELAELTPSDLPIINKTLLMGNFACAVTDPRLKKNDLERWLHENRNPAANYCDDFIVVHSSKGGRVLADNRVKIMDIGETILQDYFAMMMLVDLTDMTTFLLLG